MNETEIKSGYSYTCHHNPSGEDWYLLGIDVKRNKVCVAGWPPTMANLSDCTELEVNEPLTEEELSYRQKKFGGCWL